MGNGVDQEVSMLQYPFLGNRKVSSSDESVNITHLGERGQDFGPFLRKYEYGGGQKKTVKSQLRTSNFGSLNEIEFPCQHLQTRRLIPFEFIAKGEPGGWYRSCVTTGKGERPKIAIFAL